MRKLTQNIVGNWNKSDYALVNQSSTTNMYIEQQGDGSSSTSILRSIRGNSLLESIPGKCKGIFVASRGYLNMPVVYYAANNDIYCIYEDINGNVDKERVLSISDTLDRITFAENGGQTKETAYVFLADGINVYAIPNRLNPVDQANYIVKPALPMNTESNRTIQPTHCVYLYNYLVVNDQNTDAFYLSYQYPLEQKLPLYDNTGTVIVDEDGNIRYEDEISKDIFQVEPNHLYYADGERTGFVTYSEWKPDVTNAISTNGTYLYTFGPQSTQIFQYTSEVDAPFKSPTNSANGIGCKAPNSVTQNADYIFFLGSAAIGNYGIYRYSDQTLEKISTPDLERHINSLTDATDAVGQSWVEDGHLFYALTFNKADTTFVYDMLSKSWHIRESNNGKWALNNANTWQNYAIFGTDDGLVYLNNKKYDNWDDTPILRKRIGGCMLAEHQPFALDELRLLVDSDRQNGTIYVRWRSSDGNVSDWYTLETGTDYLNRLSIWNLGVHEMLTVEIRYTDNTPFALLGGEIKFSLIDV